MLRRTNRAGQQISHCIESLEFRRLLAAQPVMVRDLNQATDTSEPSNLIDVNGTVYFVASDAVHGQELWKSDGTSAGTKLVKDINPDGSSAPQGLTVLGKTLYFSADDGLHGRELWKTDGTSAGTCLVKDIQPGGEGFRIEQLTVMGSSLYFFDGTGLWKSNGTATGTKKVTSYYWDSGPEEVTVVGNTLFFVAMDWTWGRELWKSDGTKAGTKLVKDIYPGWPYSDGDYRPVQSTPTPPAVTVEPMDSDPPNGSDPSGLTAFGGKLYFFANAPTHGRELWRSDGTESGTQLVKDINPSEEWYEYNSDDPHGLTAAGGSLYFVANDGTHGLELWKTDGKASGTKLVKDIKPGSNEYSGPYNSEIGDLAAMGDTIYFTADDGSHGRELWKSNGTASGTKLVKDIMPGEGDSEPLDDDDSISMLPTVVGNTLYFVADDGTHGNELWMSNSSGTKLVRDIRPLPATEGYSPTPSELTAVGNTLLFVQDDGVHGRELWKSDGTSSGTKLVKDINVSGLGSEFGDYTAVGSTLFFTTSDPSHGGELWKSDGTSAGTKLVKDIFPGVAGSNPAGLVAVGKTLYFAADDGSHGRELWKSDGTESGTRLVKDIRPGSDDSGALSSSPEQLTAVGSTLYFTAFDESLGWELWKSDGTSSGTKMVKDIYPGFGPPQAKLTPVGSKLYFIGSDGKHGAELWTSDGTSTGTRMVKDLSPSKSDYASHLTNFTAAGGTIYFSAYEESHGYELWKSDGTSSGTRMIKDIYPGAGGSQPGLLTAVDGTLFFMADDKTHGTELWKSDGTPSGTKLVKDLNPGPSRSFATEMKAMGNTLFFVANDGLWKSDGTSVGTKRISEGAEQLVLVGSTLYFSATDSYGLFRSDGTAAGTTPVKALFSRPNHLTAVGSTLFFAAYDAVHGQELWKL